MSLFQRAKPVHKTKSELIISELRSLIFDGRLAPGQRLILREIAQEFGCSEIPVREALNSLASLGLVTITPHEGARVSQFDLRELIEMTEIRLILEREATLKAAQNLAPDTVGTLEGLLSKMEEAVAAKDAQSYGELNRAFHQTIFEHCSNAKLVATIHGLREQTQRGRAVHNLVPTHNRQSMMIHKRIVKTLAPLNLKQLEAVLNEHNSNALRAMERLAVQEEAASARKQAGSV